jgi:hypothetical protein
MNGYIDYPFCILGLIVSMNLVLNAKRRWLDF